MNPSTTLKDRLGIEIDGEAGPDRLRVLTPLELEWKRRIYDRLLEEVQPGFPAALANGQQPHIVPTANSSGRRTALANWIASEDNPLTARVFVNRVWAQYFGHGIVDSVSDFGKMGDKPVNPELLDYLADTFVHQDHWSIKSLQRRVLLSSVYRQASAARPDAEAIDPTSNTPQLIAGAAGA